MPTVMFSAAIRALMERPPAEKRPSLHWNPSLTEQCNPLAPVTSLSAGTLRVASVVVSKNVHNMCQRT